jgi:hypothetical protein
LPSSTGLKPSREFPPFTFTKRKKNARNAESAKESAHYKLLKYTSRRAEKLILHCACCVSDVWKCALTKTA